MRLARPFQLTLSTLAILATLAGTAPVNACEFFDWLFHRTPQQVAVVAPNPCNPCDPCAGNCQPTLGQPLAVAPMVQPTTVGFRGPVFRSVFAPVPVTAFRPVAGIDPNGTANVVLSPCQTQTMMVQRVPTQAFRPILRPTMYGGAAQTSYYAPVFGQTANYAPTGTQVNYAQPMSGLDHAYEGRGVTSFAAPTAVPMAAPAMMAPPMITGPAPGCSCNRMPVAAGYPVNAGYPVAAGYPTGMSLSGPIVPGGGYPASANYPGYSNYPTGVSYAAPAPTSQVITGQAAPAVVPTSPAVTVPGGSANVAPSLQPAELQRVPLNALPMQPLPLGPVRSAAPVTAAPNMAPVAPLTSVTPVGPAANGVYYPKPAVSTPSQNLRPLPDLEAPVAPQLKPAPPLLNPNDRTALNAPVRTFDTVPAQWAAAPIATTDAIAAPVPVQSAIFNAPAVPTKLDDSGWRAAK